MLRSFALGKATTWELTHAPLLAVVVVEHVVARGGLQHASVEARHVGVAVALVLDFEVEHVENVDEGHLHAA